jgi:hypothetical protein
MVKQEKDKTAITVIFSANPKLMHKLKLRETGLL